MVAMSESKFTAEFKGSIKKLYPDAVYQKHSDRFTKGIGDAEVVNAGMSYWFELKCRVGRGGSLVGQSNHQFKPLQIKYLTDRIKAGIKGYGLARLDIDTAILIPGDKINDYSNKSIVTSLENNHGIFVINKHNGIWQIKLEICNHPF